MKPNNRQNSEENEDEIDMDSAFSKKNGKTSKIKTITDTNNQDKSQSQKSQLFKKYRKRFKFCIRRMIKSQGFYWAVILLVFLNALCAAVEHYNMPPWLTEFLCKYYTILNILYIIINFI